MKTSATNWLHKEQAFAEFSEAFSEFEVPSRYYLLAFESSQTNSNEVLYKYVLIVTFIINYMLPNYTFIITF
jgi:hypothetical protein